MLPGADYQLIAAGRTLPGLHRGGDAAAGPRVLKLGVVGRLAALEDVELAADEVGGGGGGDYPGGHVLRGARLPVRAVVGLVAAAQDVRGLPRMVGGKPVGVVGLDPGQVGEQGWVAGAVTNRVDRVGPCRQPEVRLVELEVEQTAH